MSNCDKGSFVHLAVNHAYFSTRLLLIQDSNLQVIKVIFNYPITINLLLGYYTLNDDWFTQLISNILEVTLQDWYSNPNLFHLNNQFACHCYHLFSTEFHRSNISKSFHEKGMTLLFLISLNLRYWS